MMNSRENMHRIIEFNQPERIGYDFNPPHDKDILWIPAARYQSADTSSRQWGRHPDLLRQVPCFNGEVRLDDFGNIVGRLNQKTKGEIIRGCLQDDWQLLDAYAMPEPDHSYDLELAKARIDNPDRFMLAVLPLSPFSTARDLRLLEQFLADIILEPEAISRLLNLITIASCEIIRTAAQAGADGICIYDDWGTQNALMISPDSWRSIFKPVYQKLIDQTHELNMKFFMHSCGDIHEIMADLVEIGLDVFQLDQPELLGIDYLAGHFGGQVTFWCPVDIQRTMTTGDQALIRATARSMAERLGRFDGGFIAKDYPSWADIDIPEEWASWARDEFIRIGRYR